MLWQSLVYFTLFQTSYEVLNIYKIYVQKYVQNLRKNKRIQEGILQATLGSYNGLIFLLAVPPK